MANISLEIKLKYFFSRIGLLIQTTQSICSTLRCIKDVKWICAITNRNENCNITAYNANSIRIVMPKNFNCNHQRPRWPQNYFYIKMIKANTP